VKAGRRHLNLTYRIASITRVKVHEVLDVHLGLLSAVICTIIWPVCYGQIEANAIGPFRVLCFGKHAHAPWWLVAPRLYLTLRTTSYSITSGVLSGSPKDLSSHISILRSSGSNRGEECGRQRDHRTSPILRRRDHVPAPTSIPYPTPNSRSRKLSTPPSKKVKTDSLPVLLRWMRFKPSNIREPSRSR